MVYNSTDGWSDPAKTTQRFPCLTEDLMPRAKMGCRICGGAAASGLRICPDCRKAIGRPVLRCAGIVAVLALAAVGGYRLLRAPQPSAPQKPPDFRLPTRPPDSPPQQAATQSHQEATSSGSFFPQTSLVEPARRAPLSPDMSAPQNTLIAGQFVTAITQDRQGNMWFGSEEYGVVRFTKDGERTHFTSKHGLGDDNGYALVADADNNIWVGTLNHGLSKYDGKTWTTYSLLDGLGGLRVYCLAASPDGRTIWCGHENGVTRFDGKTWRWFSLADGLPWREITAVAAGKDGTAWVGGAMGGLGYFDGRTWTRFGKDAGLPDERINGLCLAKDGKVWIATCQGAACYNPQELSFEPVSPPDASFFGVDSFVTCVAEDQAGCIWFGTRRAGLATYDSLNKQWKRISAEQHNLPDNYIDCMLVASDGELWLSLIGYGVYTSELEKITVPREVTPPLPSAEEVQSTSQESQFDDFENPLSQVREAAKGPLLQGPMAVYIGEDWQTEGNWIGNYGDYLYVLAAMGYPQNFVNGSGRSKVDFMVLTGDNRKPQDGLAGWVHWGHTQVKKSLQNPLESDRRQASWDDRGENYPPTEIGPDLYINISISEAGLFRLALYFANKDSHEMNWRSYDGLPGSNRFRDYDIVIKQWTPTVKDTGPSTWTRGRNKEFGWVPSEDQFDKQRQFACCRLHDFAGGVYKRFIVTGPAAYRIRIARNSSHNTICSGIFVDRVVPGRSNPGLENMTTDMPPDKLPTTIRVSSASEYYNLLSRNTAALLPSYVDQRIYLCSQVKKILKAAEPTRADLELHRLAIKLLNEAGLLDTELFEATLYAASWRDFALAHRNDSTAIDGFQAAADELWDMHYKYSGMALATHGWTTVEIPKLFWKEYFRTLRTAFPQSDAMAIITRIAESYESPRIRPTCMLFELHDLAWDFLENEMPGFRHDYNSLFAKGVNCERLGRQAQAIQSFNDAAAISTDQSLKAGAYEKIGSISAMNGDDKAAMSAIEMLRPIPSSGEAIQRVEYYLCLHSFNSGTEGEASLKVSRFLSAYPDSVLAKELRQIMERREEAKKNIEAFKARLFQKGGADNKN